MIILYIGCFLSLLLGLVNYNFAETVFQQMIGLIFLVISAICFSGGSILKKLEGMHKRDDTDEE